MRIKQIGYCAAAALLLVLPECTREAEILEGAEQILTALAPDTQPVTRSQIGATGSFTWDAEDLIAIHYTNLFPAYSNYRIASLKEGAGTATAKFSLLPNGERDGFALYPSVIADKDYPGLPGGVLRVHMPQSYPLKSTSMGWTAPLPMLASNVPGQDLNFAHLAALVRLTLNAVPAGTQYIKVSSDYNLSGSFVVQDLGGEPYIAADNSNTGGDFPFMVFSFPSALGTATSGLVLNVPFPTGHYTNFSVTALDASHLELSCVNLGVDRVLARGKMRELTIDFSGDNRLTTFTASPVTVTITGFKNLPYTLKQVKTGGGEELATGYTITVDNVSNPDIARYSVSGNNVAVTGLSAGETDIRLKAVKGTDIIYANTQVTVADPILSIWSTSDKLFPGGTMKMRASVAYVGTDITNSEDLLYDWSLSEGGSLATIISDGPSHAVLTAGNTTGTVKVRCRISSNDPDGLLTSMETSRTFTIMDPPAGALPALFSISASQKVYFAQGNAYKQKSDGKYYLFDRQWEAYNGVVNQLAPEDADIMDCVDPMTVVAEFGNASTSVPITVGTEETSGWRLFKYDEINYLLNRRLSSPVGAADNARYICAKVGGLAGLILFPDEFIWPEEMLLPRDINKIKMGDAAWIRLDFPNSYTFAEWTEYMQPRGAVFLPGWIDAPAYLSQARWNDTSIPSKRKRNDTSLVDRPWNYYTSWYFCYYIDDSYMLVDRPMSTLQVHITTPEYYPIDYVRYFHLRPIKDVQ